MKKILLLVLLLFITSSETFAYIEKIYNEKGYQIGYARKNGENYTIYDLNDKEVTDFEAFYKSEGNPNKRKLKLVNCWYDTLPNTHQKIFCEDVYPLGTNYNTPVIPLVPLGSSGYKVIKTGF